MIRTTIRIAIIDDHALVRLGLRQFFSEQADMQVVAEAGSGRGALDLVRAGGLDVLLLDLAMPEQGGVEVLAGIRARAPALPVLILSGYAEADYAITLLRQGASGYLGKDGEPEELLKAVRALAEGRRYFSAKVAEHMAARLCAGQPGDASGPKLPAHERLSERELQVFLRLAQGQTISHLADGLCLSVKTVSTYRTRVMEKLALASNSDLTYYALKHGLIR